jgi:hypothetical protein
MKDFITHFGVLVCVGVVLMFGAIHLQKGADKKAGDFMGQCIKDGGEVQIIKRFLRSKIFCIKVASDSTPKR